LHRPQSSSVFAAGGVGNIAVAPLYLPLSSPVFAVVGAGTIAFEFCQAPLRYASLIRHPVKRSVKQAVRTSCPRCAVQSLIEPCHGLLAAGGAIAAAVRCPYHALLVLSSAVERPLLYQHWYRLLLPWIPPSRVTHTRWLTRTPSSPSPSSHPYNICSYRTACWANMGDVCAWAMSCPPPAPRH
jgi:hypothetical protein